MTLAHYTVIHTSDTTVKTHLYKTCYLLYPTCIHDTCHCAHNTHITSDQHRGQTFWETPINLVLKNVAEWPLWRLSHVLCLIAASASITSKACEKFIHFQQVAALVLRALTFYMWGKMGWRGGAGRLIVLHNILPGINAPMQLTWGGKGPAVCVYLLQLLNTLKFRTLD